MPALINTKAAVKPWIRPAETAAPLDWAPLSEIDFLKFDKPGGMQELANDLHDAVKRWGFWTVINSGIPDEQVDKQIAIGNTFFELPLEEKRKVACDFAVGNYFGYREPTRFIGKTDVKENMEMLNLPKYDFHYDSTPRHDFIRAYRDEIAPFHRLVWEKVVKRLMTLFAIILELPEDHFVERHAYDRPSEDHLRYMIYHPRSAEEDHKIGSQWSAGHTDFGSLTLLFSQSVAALQIKAPDDEWKWVRYVPGGITCNAADTLSFLTKGYIKSTVHRVVRPPPDQASLERIGLFYFVRPGDAVKMVPAPSPVLLREGLIKEEDLETRKGDAPPVTGYEYVRARVKNVHDRAKTRWDEDRVGEKFQVGNLQVQDFYK